MKESLAKVNITFVADILFESLPVQGGIYVFQLFDYFSVSRTIFVVAFCECLVIAYVYGMSDGLHEKCYNFTFTNVFISLSVSFGGLIIQ